MLNPKKKDSILQWFNCISVGKGVVSLKEFASGFLLYQVIISLKGNEEKESCSDKLENPTNGVTHHEEILTEIEEQPICENDANNDVQCENVCESSDAISINSTSHTINAKTDESVKINTPQNTVSEIIQNGSENANSDEVVCSENTDTSVHCTNESSGVSVACEKNSSALANGACSMEVSIEDDNFKTENNSMDQIDTSTSAPEENSRAECLEIDDNSKSHKMIPEVQKRYEAIKTFIDGMLELKSEDLVNYTECINGNEFELAKLAVLFLCAWLQSYLLTENFAFESTICHLDQEIQEEIKECLELFLIKREAPVKKRDFQDVLIRTVRPRCSPRWSTPISVASQVSKTRSRRTRRNVQIIEDVTIESSPLKSFLQSPDLRHITPNTKQAVIQDAVSKKNKQISELFESLEEERYKNKDLEEKNENLNSQIQRLREEKNKLKTSHNEELKLLEDDKEILLKAKEDLEEQNRILKQQIEQLQEDLKFAEKENPVIDEKICGGINIEAEDPKVQSRILSLEFHLKRKEEKIQELENDIAHLERVELEYESIKEICETNIDNCIDLQKALSEHEFGSGRCKIHDYSMRDELEKDLMNLEKALEERDNHLKQYKGDTENKLKELENELKDLRKSENDWKVKFRKADRERENIQRSSSKKILSLEHTVAKLSAQNEAYVNALNVYKECHSKTSVIDDSEMNVSKKRFYDKDEAGRLWEAFTSGNSESVKELPNSEMDPENKNKDFSNSSTLLCETRAARRRKSLNEPLQEKQNKSNVSCTESSPAMESTNGWPQCTENELKEIKSSVMNIFKAIESINVKSDLLPSSIEECEKNFNSAQDLVNALVIIFKIIQNDFNVLLQSSQIERSEMAEKNHKTSNSLCEAEQHSPVQEKLLENPLEKTFTKLVPSKNVETMTDLYDFPDINMPGPSFSASPESAKVASLKLIIKQMKKEFETNQKVLQEQLTKAEDIKGKFIQKFIKIKDENENLKKSIQDLEKKVVLNNKQIIQSKKPCEKCPSLMEKFNLYRNERYRLMKIMDKMKQEAKVQEQTILSLKEKIKNLTNINENLKMSVDRLKCWNSGNWADPLLKAAEKLGKPPKLEDLKQDQEKESTEDEWQENPESLNEIMDPRFEDDQSSNISSLNCYKDSKVRHLSAFCFPEDEDDIPNESSVSEVNPKARLSELQWRNSLYLPHLKSTYPLELNTTPTASKYTMVPAAVTSQPSKQASTSVQYSNKSKKCRQLSYKEHSSPKKHVKRPLPSTASTSKSSTYKAGAVDSDDVNKHSAKKRKITKTDKSSRSVNNSQSDQRTPKQNSITQKIFKTPQSYYRLMNRMRKH